MALILSTALFGCGPASGLGPRASSPSASPSVDVHHYAALYSAFHRPSLPFRIIPFFATGGSLLVWRSAAEVQASFARPDIGYETPPALPPVDFSQEMIIRVHMPSGTNWSRGEIVGVEEQAYGLLVHIVQWEPDPSPSPRLSVEGFFSEAVVVPKSDKPVVLAQLLTGNLSTRSTLFTEASDPKNPPIPLPAPLYPSPLLTPRPGPS